MTMSATRKTELIQEYRSHSSDTGSAEVQIAMLSERIRSLTEHFKTHKKDHASRRGLLQMVGRRATLLKYLKRRSPDKHDAVVKKLGIRAS